MRSVIVPLAAVFVLSGCPSKTAELDAGSVGIDAGDADASALEVDAGPPAPKTLEPSVIAGLGDGGTIAITAQATIDPPATLTVNLPAKLKDFRLRLLDWRDQVVVSDDELMADGLTYVITLTEPLKTGRGYSLVLDAELGPVITSESGATFNDWELAFRISGDVQPEAPARKPATKKKPGSKK